MNPAVPRPSATSPRGKVNPAGNGASTVIAPTITAAMLILKPGLMPLIFPTQRDVVGIQCINHARIYGGTYRSSILKTSQRMV